MFTSTGNNFGAGSIQFKDYQAENYVVLNAKFTYDPTMLGLSTQVPMNVVYLTDGSNRKVNVKNGRGILFRHVSPKTLAFNDKLAMLITTALRDLGSNNVTDEHRKQLKAVLEQHPVSFSIHDMKLMPLWIRNLITELYEQLHTTH